MAKITYSDIHCFSPIALMTPDELKLSILKDLEEGHEVYSMGDNSDIANCKRDDIKRAYELDAWLSSHCTGYVSGNHELAAPFSAYAPHGYMLLAHGDVEKWGFKRAEKYRNKKPCASKFKRKFIVRMLEKLDDVWANRATKKFKKRAAAAAKAADCAVYVCGHIHPKKKIHVLHDDVEIVVVPRGRSFLNV